MRSGETGPDGASSFGPRPCGARPFSVREVPVEKITVLFPSADAEATKAHPDWAAEVAACESTSLFYPILYNEEAFAKGAGLRVSSPAPTKRAYCIRRGRLFRDEQYRHGKGTEMEHALKRFGYVEALRCVGMYGWPYGTEYPPKDYDTRKCSPETVTPYHRYLRLSSGEYGWYPDLHVLREVLPAVAKNDAGTLCRPDGTPVVIRDLPTWAATEEVIQRMSARPLEELSGTFLEAQVSFQRYLDIAKASDGTPVEWRVFFLEGRVVSAMLKFAPGAETRVPKPPEGLFAPFRQRGSFEAVDYAQDVGGRWWILKLQAGEQAPVPPGGSAAAFYGRLEEEILRGPAMPEWSWCLVADVVRTHALGETKATVEGTRHFAPGTTVVFADAYWGMGGERCTVLGVPKYSDELVGVTLRSELLENFRCERIDDGSVMRALATNRLGETFKRDRKTCLLGGHGLWGQTEEARERLEARAASINEWLGRVRVQREKR